MSSQAREIRERPDFVTVGVGQVSPRDQQHSPPRQAAMPSRIATAAMLG
jgi:hypothetical protein